MDKVRIALERTETELGEWKDQLGDKFPSFLSYHLMARLMKAEGEVLHLSRCLKSSEVFR
jgi:hypothetical protein